MKGRNTEVEVKGSGWYWNGSSFPVFTHYSVFPFYLRFLSLLPFLPSLFSHHPSYLVSISFPRLDVSLVTRLDNNTLLFPLFRNSLLGRGFVYSSSVLIKSFWRPLVSTVRASKIQTTTTATSRGTTRPLPRRSTHYRFVLHILLPLQSRYFPSTHLDNFDYPSESNSTYSTYHPIITKWAEKV